eukprot:CAMPEP_0115259430 /NCGR_PEP_ID=MMETSP0270-20121206/47819_1 /TAXON_ID=71861 /ORGANISM="Scrippsiella trochoidea, Strain CCMP3099" /LENGTH=201 /DNA_ID=CAMNT_0002675237 /DNA_START=70 /DNA_END=675 /DNA_ORIENTATION=-
MAMPDVSGRCSQLIMLPLLVLVRGTTPTYNFCIDTPLACGLDVEALGLQLGGAPRLDVAACQHNFSKVAGNSWACINNSPVVFDADAGTKSAKDDAYTVMAEMGDGSTIGIAQQDWAAGIDQFLVQSRYKKDRRQEWGGSGKVQVSHIDGVLGSRSLRPVSFRFHDHDCGRVLTASAAEQLEASPPSVLVTSLVALLTQMA